jgi:membrane carboxypeptidase/penicillin-binding protein PbpC
VRGGRVRLPDEYGGWVAQAGSGFQLASSDPLAVDPRDVIDSDAFEPRAPVRAPRDGAAATGTPVAEPRGFRIVSPAEGDVYRMPPGVPADYATVALRAAGAVGSVRWFVDGAPHAAARWRLRPGAHVIRAVAESGSVTEVRIRVEE